MLKRAHKNDKINYQPKGGDYYGKNEARYS